MISFTTNATLADFIRLKYFLPNVLRVFGERLSELVVIIDAKPEEGRISVLQQSNKKHTPLSGQLIAELSGLDKRIRFAELDYSQVKDISRKWFAQDSIIRCQAGTPIFAFLYGLEISQSPRVFRSDCDMLFNDKGFIDKINEAEESIDLIQPPFLRDMPGEFSSRAFFVNRQAIERKLPLQPAKLGFLRQLHRRYHQRPVFMALEQIFEHNIQRNNLNCVKQTTALGHTMHLPKREDFHDANIEEIISRFNSGIIPAAQLAKAHDFAVSCWQ